MSARVVVDDTIFRVQSLKIKLKKKITFVIVYNDDIKFTIIPTDIMMTILSLKF